MADSSSVRRNLIVAELGSFKFVRHKTKLAGTIRDSFLVIEDEF